uniref:Uncharacterized protein n=1 Tax=Strombidium inclinatum TaxID=197538 RepID=A0A7S3N1M1_9SPIT|mmetsp:Transcript_32879/g.50274  ORF Transcript_32879/g.50274 Transcript_32879/m.50274 type:complete len:181 (+) Transcript_32879:363-905(+)
MIESARKNLESMGIIDQFELVCADVFDENFQLPEKVDCVVLSYTLTTFINSFEMLEKILTQCRKQVKDSGYMFVADFSWGPMPKDGFWGGMYTAHPDEPVGPKEFETFEFFIDKAPEEAFQIFQIPHYLMFKAGYAAGFRHIEYKPQYPDPELKDDPVIRRYIDECNPADYLMKFKFMNP